MSGKQVPMLPNENQQIMNVLWGDQFAVFVESIRRQAKEEVLKELEEDDRLSACELASRLHINESTVRRMANTDPDFPRSLIGRSKRYSFKKVVKYLEGKTKKK